MIEQALSDLGKSSIPVYVLYPADPAQDPYILPEILTPQIITNFLEKI